MPRRCMHAEGGARRLNGHAGWTAMYRTAFYGRNANRRTASRRHLLTGMT